MNYIGSKTSLLEFIDTVARQFTDNHTRSVVVCDAFAGTGSVGSFFRRSGHTVIANDIQYYSFILNKNLIENKGLNLDRLEYLNQLAPVEGFIYKTYCAGSGSGRMYFSDENGQRCDAIRQEIERMYTQSEITQAEYYAYLASLIEAVDKVANTASVYGAYLKQLKSSAQKPLVLVSIVPQDGPVGEVYNSDSNQLMREASGDILYLDPPYNARQYAANYHVLETIARYDNPVVHGKTGLRDTVLQRSKYSSKRSVAAEFEDIIAHAAFKVIIVSYNNEGLMTPSTVRDIMSRYGEYSVHEQEYRRYRADRPDRRNHKAVTTKEYLHVLVKHAG